MSFRNLSILTSLISASLLIPNSAGAHGFAGDRFFPSTLTTDDPFVASEASFPTIDTMKTPDGRVEEIGGDISLRLTPRFGIAFGETYTKIEPPGERHVAGFQNLAVSGIYELYTNDPHEAILSLGLDVDVGGTGHRLIGAESYTTWKPAIKFGKGFGDLSPSLNAFRPLALTGNIGFSIPGESHGDGGSNPHNLELGFALEYSLIYLQEHVKDVGLKAPFNRLIPLVELNLEDPLDRGQAGQYTATINPGLIWSGQYFQLGAEALIPLNSRTGSNAGVLVQVHFYLDDLFPRVFGQPLIGGRR